MADIPRSEVFSDARVSGALGLALASCVPSKEFSQLSGDKNEIQQERDDLMRENEFLTVENREMNGKIGKVEAQQEKLVNDSIRIYKQVEKLVIPPILVPGPKA